jgi:hypothetical protein
MFIAGLLAGLMLNVSEGVLHGVVLADATVEAMAALGSTESGSGSGLGLLLGITFVQGVLGIWLYGLLAQGGRKRVLAAVTAGLALWALSAVYSAVYLGAGLPGLLPAAVVWLPVAWGLIEYPLAVFVGTFVLRER